MLSRVALSKVAIVKLMRMKRVKLGSTSMIFKKRWVLWLLSQVALAALKVLWLLSCVALAKVVINKLLRMKREPG